MDGIKIGRGIISPDRFKLSLNKFLNSFTKAYLNGLIPNKTDEERIEVLTDLYNKVNKVEPVIEPEKEVENVIDEPVTKNRKSKRAVSSDDSGMSESTQ